jgi:hypothetical protein
VRKTVILLLFAVAFLAGCNRHRANNTGAETTQTIAPATAQPAAVGTDTKKVTKTTKPPVKKKTTKK